MWAAISTILPLCSNRHMSRSMRSGSTSWAHFNKLVVFAVFCRLDILCYSGLTLNRADGETGFDAILEDDVDEQRWDGDDDDGSEHTT